MSSAQLDKDFCIQKLDAVSSLIRGLLEGDFPHPDTKVGLQQLQAVYDQEKAKLESLSPAAADDTVLAYCLDANVRIVHLKAFLGHLVRSSNLRNAFEMFFPIKVLARDLLPGRNPKLILSSEWDFSPFAYGISPDELPDFIFIGLPASESQNALTLPLAAHELGHVVWRRQGVREKFDSKIKQKVLDLFHQRWAEVQGVFSQFKGLPPDIIEKELFAQQLWGQSLAYARRQVEEVFCDFVGLHVFGAAFLHAFRYLLSPSLGRYRSEYYPAIKKRVQYMLYAAAEHGIKEPPGFSESFYDQPKPMNRQFELLVNFADQATEQLYPEIVALVDDYKGTAPSFRVSDAELARIRASLEALAPAEGASIASIVNAGWLIRANIGEWKILENEADPEKRDREKMRILNDLILKSFEVFEFRKRIEANAS